MVRLREGLLEGTEGNLHGVEGEFKLKREGFQGFQEIH